jgi:hypothetical protein
MTVARDIFDTPQSGAIVLQDGDVLVIGGVGGNDNVGENYILASMERYNETRGTFVSAGDMSDTRWLPGLALLSDGTVIIAGGIDQENNILSSVDIYDPVSGVCTATMPMETARFGLTASVLPNGTVAAFGGLNNSGILASAEIFRGAARASLLCTAQDGTTPADGSEARFARRRDISWPTGCSDVISLSVQHADGTIYDLTGCALDLTIRLPSSVGGYDASVLPAQGTLQTVMDDFTHALLTYQPNLKVLGPNDSGGEVRPPSIAWRPTQGRWDVGGNRTLGKPNEPGLLWRRWPEVVFKVFGGDVGEPDYGLTPTEGLVELLINCLQQRFTMHNYRPVSERWLQMGRTGRGMACELTVAIGLPVVRIDNSTVTVKAFSQTTRIVDLVVPNE